MPNIQFNYLYRDSANYKKYGSVIFVNPDEFDLSYIESIIKSKLIYGEWFYADQWKLPELFLETFDFRIDPTWHEFESVEYRDEPPNSITSVNAFIELITS